MTYEEAIKTIEIAIAEIEWDFPMEYSEAFQMAINSLKKQMPKKPINQGRWSNNKGWSFRYGLCPNPLCDNGVNYEMGYCDNCGQLLDWTEDAE